MQFQSLKKHFIKSGLNFCFVQYKLDIFRLINFDAIRFIHDQIIDFDIHSTNTKHLYSSFYIFKFIELKQKCIIIRFYT